MRLCAFGLLMLGVWLEPPRSFSSSSISFEHTVAAPCRRRRQEPT